MDPPLPALFATPTSAPVAVPAPPESDTLAYSLTVGLPLTSFDTALRLYYTNAEVNETNFVRLSALNQPVKKVEAQNKGRDADLDMKKILQKYRDSVVRAMVRPLRLGRG